MPKEDHEKTIASLRRAYTMEMETVANYLANSIDLDGVRAEEIKKSLQADITEELGHAQQLGQRIKQLGGLVPGSLDLKFGQKELQPSADTTDVVGVIRGVISAEKQAIAHYQQIIRDTDGADYVTQDLCVQLLSQEEAHRVMFEGFLKEYEKQA